jgi:hypothetical protein
MADERCDSGSPTPQLTVMERARSSNLLPHVGESLVLVASSILEDAHVFRGVYSTVAQ